MPELCDNKDGNVTDAKKFNVVNKCTETLTLKKSETKVDVDEWDDVLGIECFRNT